jgi:PAS domain S-box-containing protein
MKTEIYAAERKVAERSLQESEQRYNRLLASTTDYVYTVTVNRDGSVATSHGPGCKAVTGYASCEFGADPLLWSRMIYEEDRPAVLTQVAHILKGEVPSPLEHRIVHKDGNIRWIQNTPIPHVENQGRVVAYDGHVSDITHRKRAEQLLIVQYAVTCQLAGSDNLHEAMTKVLKTVCETLPWDFAAFWSIDAKANVLRCDEIWHLASAPLEELAAMSRASTLASGVGLPGKVWARTEPTWIADITQQGNGPRAPLARKVGLHAACASPICRGKEMVGVIELFSLKILPPDDHMLAMLTAVSRQIAQFIERKRAEEALTTERNLLRTLIDNLPDYIYAKDTESRFVMNNLAHMRVLGASQLQDVLGKTDLDFFPRELALQYRADEEALLQSGQPLFNREEVVADPQGNRQWVLATKVPLKDSRGKIVGLVGVSHDITESKRVEEERRLSGARLQAILDNSPAVIYLKDTQGRYLLINRRFEEMFHWRREEVVGKMDDDLFSKETANTIQMNDQKVVAALAALEFEEVATHDDGPHTYISVKFPLLDATGAAYAVCGLSTDITRRKQAEEQLKRAYAELGQSEAALTSTLQELKASHEELKTTELQLIQAAKLESIGTLAAGIAHEVKNPLQTMLMGLHYLAHNLPAGNEGVTRALGDMRDAVQQANSIIQSVLQLSAAAEFETKVGDLNALIERSLGLIHSELIASQVTVSRKLAKNLPPVQMDRGKMEQVFINLFINALQAMPQGGDLTVATRAVQLGHDLALHEPIFRHFKAGDTVLVAEVQDTGTGVLEAHLAKLFDPFFTTKAVGIGTGLGLSVSKKIVDLHGGAIDIRNAPQRGAVVTLVLKAKQEESTWTKNAS